MYNFQEYSKGIDNRPVLYHTMLCCAVLLCSCMLSLLQRVSVHCTATRRSVSCCQSTWSSSLQAVRHAHRASYVKVGGQPSDQLRESLLVSTLLLTCPCKPRAKSARAMSCAQALGTGRAAVNVRPASLLLPVWFLLNRCASEHLYGGQADGAPPERPALPCVHSQRVPPR